MSMATKIFKAVIMGAPASGKGTVSSRIVKSFNLNHLSSGDILRLHLEQGTDIGLEAKKYMAEGKLVPDTLMINLILDEIKKSANKSFLLDGFPRTVNQAEQLSKVLNLNLCINLVVPFEVIIERVKGRWVHLPSGRVYHNEFEAPKVMGRDDATGEDLIQREDDKPEVVMKRLEQYEQMSRPLIEYYRKLGILEEFHGKSTNEIWPKILDCLSSYIPLHIRTKKSS